MQTKLNRQNRVRQWLSDRLPIESLLQYLAKKEVPQHKHSFWYYFGGLTLFFFLIQVVTGLLLALYYKPSPDQAFESVRQIVNEVPHGWLIRSIHSWSANLLVGTLLVHMFSTYFLSAYRKPRELMWVSGMLLLFLILGFCFTGYLLPWDTVAYFATLIGTEVPRTLPIVGDWGVSILKGGEEIGTETLNRMYILHISFLPLISILIITFHVLMNQVLGSSIPPGIKKVGRPIPFFPNFMYRDLIAWTLGFAVIMLLAMLSPWGLGEKADPLASAPAGIKPEWYFLPLYQSLRMAPASIFGVSGELIVNILVSALALFWLCIPFMDRDSRSGRRSRIFPISGILLTVYIVVTIILAYTT
jgi:cytochrome b6